MNYDDLMKLWKLHHEGPGLKLDTISGLSGTIQPARETVTMLLKLALAGLYLENALNGVTYLEICSARHMLRSEGKTLTHENIAEEVMSARRNNYSVYWK